jgi:hypothetical protein
MQSRPHPGYQTAGRSERACKCDRLKGSIVSGKAMDKTREITHFGELRGTGGESKDHRNQGLWLLYSGNRKGSQSAPAGYLGLELPAQTSAFAPGFSLPSYRLRNVHSADSLRGSCSYGETFGAEEM